MVLLWFFVQYNWSFFFLSLLHLDLKYPLGEFCAQKNHFVQASKKNHSLCLIYQNFFELHATIHGYLKGSDHCGQKDDLSLGLVAGSQNFAKVKKNVFQSFKSQFDLVDDWLA